MFGNSLHTHLNRSKGCIRVLKTKWEPGTLKSICRSELCMWDGRKGPESLGVLQEKLVPHTKKKQVRGTRKTTKHPKRNQQPQKNQRQTRPLPEVKKSVRNHPSPIRIVWFPFHLFLLTPKPFPRSVPASIQQKC